jgi:hypothetical protein
MLSRAGRRMLAIELGACGAMAVASAGISIRGRSESWSVLPRVITVFLAFNWGYGIGMPRGGMLRGWARAAALTATLRRQRSR